MYTRKITLFIGTMMGLMIPIVSAVTEAGIKTAGTNLGSAAFGRVFALASTIMPYLAVIAIIVYALKYGLGGSKTKKEQDDEQEDPFARNVKRILIAIIALGLASFILKVFQALTV